MQIINIYERKEYFHFLKLFIFYIFTIIFYSDFVYDKEIYKTFIILFTILIIHYLFCIFLESEFDSICLQSLQVQIGNKFIIIALICLISAAFISVSYFIFPGYYYVYKISCPFIKNNVDNELHFEKRCDLYNINTNNTYPYQYICSYNVEDIRVSYFFKFRSTPFRKCRKFEKLINNNKIIDSFVEKYYKEDLYFCDILYYPSNFTSINPNYCHSKIKIYPEILIVIHFYLIAKYFKLLFYYFNYIKANVNENYYFN